MKRYKLDHIVREYMIETMTEFQVSILYPGYLQLGISALRNLNLDTKGLIKVEKIPIDQNNFIAALPNDYLNYKSVFICRRGQKIALSLNMNMCPPEYDSCGNLIVCGANNTNNNSGGYLYLWGNNVPVDSLGQFTGRQYGVGGENNSVGYFKIFEDQGYIAIQNFSLGADEIIMEYLADIDQQDGSTYVHPNDVEAVKAYIYWKSIEKVKNQTESAKVRAEKSWIKEKRKARKRHRKFTVIDVTDAMSSGFKSAPEI